jgi:hypothetical protein
MVEDSELRRRLEILRQQFADGKIVIAEHLAEDFKESLGKVRYAADGSVDLGTVDARVRSMAMMAAMMSDRDEVKSAASLADIQAAYFSRITPMFEQAHKLMRRHHAHPQSFSWAMSRDAEHVERNHPLIEPFVAELQEFWGVISEPVRYHLQDLDALKGVFGGDLFPSYEHNIASSTGLYLDTIILTDPFMNSRDLFSRWSKPEAVRMFLKHGLQLMNYRDLVLAHTSPPIVVILPFESSHNEDYRESLFSAASAKALTHAEKLFGREFSELEELQDFLTDLSKPDEVVAALVDPSRLLFDTEWERDPASNISRAIEEFSHIQSDHAGELIFNQCFGRMSQATDISWKSHSLGGVPLIDAPTSWEYFNWSLEYEAAKDRGRNLPLHVSRGLQKLANNEMQWLGNVPPDALIEIRKEGALGEIRAILTSGVDEVIALNSDNFLGSANRVYENLENAFAEHENKIKELRAKKWKFAGSDLGSWVVAGSIEVAAVLIGTPAWGLASVAVSQLTDAPKLKDIPKKAKELKREGKALSRSAAGLLFKHRQ